MATGTAELSITLTLTESEAYLLSLIIANTGDCSGVKDEHFGTQNRIGGVLKELGIYFDSPENPWALFGTSNHIQVKRK